MIALIINDPWESWFEKDLIEHPHLNEECVAFSHFLNHVCEYERSKNTQIVFRTGGKPVVDSILIEESDIVLNKITDISLTYDSYYFAGFHYGRCIHKNMEALVQLGVDPGKLRAVVNLALVYPGETWAAMLDVWPKYIDYLWSYNGFEEIKINHSEE
jgi:hypothetical protein